MTKNRFQPSHWARSFSTGGEATEAFTVARDPDHAGAPSRAWLAHASDPLEAVRFDGSSAERSLTLFTSCNSALQIECETLTVLMLAISGDLRLASGWDA